jgi:hypothetical protein
MLCQAQSSDPGLDIMLLKQQFLSVSGQAANLARQHPPVEYIYCHSHPMLQFLPQKLDCWNHGLEGIHWVYKPSPVPTLYVGRVKDLLGRVPLIPCFWMEMQPQLFHISTAPVRRKLLSAAVPMVLALTSINTWLWNFGRPQPSVGGLSVAKTEKIRGKSRSEAAKRGWATKRASK